MHGSEKKISAKSRNERLPQTFSELTGFSKAGPKLGPVFFWGKSFTHLPSQAIILSTFNPGNTSCTAPKVVQPWEFVTPIQNFKITNTDVAWKYPRYLLHAVTESTGDT